MDEVSNITAQLPFVFGYEQFHSLAVLLYSIPVFPYLYLVHVISAALKTRAELGGLQFAVEHPLASCVGCFIVAACGSMSADLMLGRSPLTSVTHGNALMVFIVWYFVFFSPLDTVYHLATCLPSKLVLGVLAEVKRSLSVLVGVVAATAVFSGSISHWPAISLVGMLKGSGANWGISLYRTIAQLPPNVADHELLKISLATKMSFACAVVYSLNELKVMHFAREDLCLLAAILLVTLKVYSVLVREADPFHFVVCQCWNIVTCASPPRQRPKNISLTKTTKQE